MEQTPMGRIIKRENGVVEELQLWIDFFGGFELGK
jgi:hypothetical protein